jgi:hypothetical protein
MIAGIDESVEFLERVERRRVAAASQRPRVPAQAGVPVAVGAAPMPEAGPSPSQPAALPLANPVDWAQKRFRFAVPLRVAMSASSFLLVAAGAYFTGAGGLHNVTPSVSLSAIQKSVEPPASPSNPPVLPRALRVQPPMTSRHAASIIRPTRGLGTALGRDRHFRVVSGLLPRQTAERRAEAISQIHLGATPRLVLLGPARAVLEYGRFGTMEAAKLLATRVRSFGYTATIIQR